MTPPEPPNLKPLPSQAQPPTEKTCPYCAETIKASAIVCRYCGRDLATGQPPGPLPTVVATKKNPAIGLAGLLIMLTGIGMFCVFSDFLIPFAVTVLGICILVFALITGNIKLFG